MKISTWNARALAHHDSKLGGNTGILTILTVLTCHFQISQIPLGWLGDGSRKFLYRVTNVTPVLVQASFAIAAAILAEATLSFLGLGPVDQASWGKLLSSATGVTGTFIWWLAIFPGLAIFLTVLAYNLLGEAFQTAIDPKLRKAAH